MNNKGMTLAEIIVSVALISIVLIFMMKLLLSLRYEETLDSYDKANSVNRTEIIHAIQDDFKSKGMPTICQRGTATESSLNLAFNYSGFTKYLKIYQTDDSKGDDKVPEYFLEYGDKKWKLLTDNNVTKFDLKNIPVEVSEFCTEDTLDCNIVYGMFKFSIPVDNGSEPGSTLDDIEILYVSKYDSEVSKKLRSMPKCFGKECQDTNNTCTN